MSRDWKPGDVAMADGCRMMRTQSGWLYASPGSLVNYTHAEGSSADHVTALARPLVVIDPEDAEQVERLRVILVNATARPIIDYELQVALREFADPKPRIEEPMGLGAVVEDDCGDLWVRVKGVQWVCGAARRPWSSFTAARVLSEGVTE